MSEREPTISDVMARLDGLRDEMADGNGKMMALINHHGERIANRLGNIEHELLGMHEFITANTRRWLDLEIRVRGLEKKEE